MADYVVRLSGQDNLSGTIKQVKNAVNDFGTVATGAMDKFKARFEKIENSAVPLKRQLRDLKALMGEMQFKGLANTDEFTRIAQYAGKVKDAMDDAANATKRFADDTFALRAAADAMTVVTGAFTAATGAMNLFGVKNEEVKNAILRVQSAIAILNGVQSIANALNKESALVQALKGIKMRFSAEMTKYNTQETNKNTISDKANKIASELDAAAKVKEATATAVATGATKASTVSQNAWNVAKAVAKALLGDFTGLLLVAAGGLMTYALATAGSTDEIEDQSKSLKKNNGMIDANAEAIERNKKMQQDWANSVANSAGEQLATYRLLQQKWQECNGDIKLQQKFMNDYKSEIDSLQLGIYNLIDAENAFVGNTEKVVNAIIARAKAEAYKDEYKKLVQQEIQINLDKSVAGGGSYYNVHNQLNHGGNSATGAEIQAYEKATGKRAIGGGGGQSGQGYVLTDEAKRWITSERQKAAIKLKKERLALNKKNQDEIAGLMKEQLDIVDENLKGAGLGGNKPTTTTTKAPKKGTTSKGGSNKGITDEQKLEALDKQIREMNQNLEYNLVPDDKVDKYIENLVTIEKSRDALAKKLGKPLIDSLDWKKQEMQIRQSNLSKGLVPEDKIEHEKKAIKNLKDEIDKEEIRLGFKIVPIDGSLADLEQKLSKLQSDLKDGLIPEDAIKKTYKEIYELEDKIVDKKIELGIEVSNFDYDSLLRAKKKAINVVNSSEGGQITVTADVSQINEINKQLRNIPKYLQDEINTLTDQLNSDNLTIEERIKITTRRDELQKQVDEIVNGKLSIPAEIRPTYVQKGSDEDLRQSYNNAQSMVNRIVDDYYSGIIKNYGEARRQIAEVNAQLKALGMKPIEIEIKTKGQQVLENVQNYLSGFAGSITSTVDAFDQLAKSIDEGASGWEIFKNIISTTETVLSSITTVMQLVNTLTAAQTALSTANAAATTADAAASAGNAAAKSAEATATAGVAVAETAAQNAKMGPFGWVMAIAGAVALAATLFTLIGKFAGGGIVGGHSYSGDQLIARVNSGEMILNQRQQRNLFNAINKGELGGGNAQTVSFKLKGSVIYGALKNYQKIKGKSGVVTGIE